MMNETFKHRIVAARGKKLRQLVEQPTSQPSKVNRIVPTRSEVWDHYTITKEDREICPCN